MPATISCKQNPEKIANNATAKITLLNNKSASDYMPSEIEDDDIKLAPSIGEAKFISKSFDNSTGVLSVKYTITI